MKQIFIFLITCINCGTIYAQNEKDTYISLHYKKYPLPSNFSFVDKFIVDRPKGDKIGLNFIDTDGNDNNFEILEYIHYDKNSKPITRGIVKGVRFHYDERSSLVHLFGIELRKTDLSDYAPLGCMSDMLLDNDNDAYDFFYELLYEDSNNKSFRLVRPGSYYQLGEDIMEYRKVIRWGDQ